MTSLRIYCIMALQFHSFDKCISHLTIPIYLLTNLASVRNWFESNNNNNPPKFRVSQFILKKEMNIKERHKNYNSTVRNMML